MIKRIVQNVIKFFLFVCIHSLRVGFLLNATKKHTAAVEPDQNKIVLNKAGSMRNGKSGRNISKEGNNDSKPMLIPADNNVAAVNPMKLSLEKRGKEFSLKGVLSVTEHKNSRKQNNPANVYKAMRGFGK